MSGLKQVVWLLALCGVSALGTARAQEPTAAVRSAYRIEIPLPIVGARDEAIQRQINQVAAKARGDQRPLVVLDFTLGALESNGEQADGATRGTSFERALSLARYLTSPAAAKVRLIAYISRPIEGHAVLPVLACEDIIASDDAELGRATLDEAKVDEVVRGAYREIVKSRQPLLEAAVAAMLDPNVEVYEVELTDGAKQVVTGTDAKRLRDEGKLISQTPIWSGGGLASFGAATLRKQGWVAKVVPGIDHLPAALNINGRLQNVQLQPEKWSAVTFKLDSQLSAQRVNQFIRSVGERRKTTDFNLLLLEVDDVNAEFNEALRLAQFLVQLQSDGVATASIVNATCATPVLMPALVCNQVFVLDTAQLGSPDRKPGMLLTLSDASLGALESLEQKTGRSASFMTAAMDPDCVVKLHVHKTNGKQLPLADWQLKRQAEPSDWVASEPIAEGGVVSHDVALQYGLIDAHVAERAAALRELGVTDEPEALREPFVETVIQRMLAFEWLPRMLVMIGFMALMIEMGSPGLGLGGFVSLVCFLGFFWIEGLNGNVEWLEVLLFIAGMTSLAVELFVLPGFGVFGIGGALMVLASIVLASQTFIFPSDSEQLTLIANNLFWVALCALMVVVGAVAMGRRLENTPVLRFLSIEPAGTDDVAELEAREAIVHWEHLLGQDGVTTTRLNPSGKAQFGRLIVNVLGTQMLDEGVAVRVVEVRGNSVFVESLE